MLPERRASWRFVGCLLFVSSHASAQFAVDAQHTGRCALRGPRAQPGITWRVRTRHRVFASPVVTPGGLVVFAGVDGSVHAVDVRGVERWARLDASPVFATPVVWGSRVVVARFNGVVEAIDEHGDSVWTWQASGDLDASPVLAPSGDTLYVATRAVTALDANGRVRWTRALPAHVYGAPAVTREGGTLLAPDVLGGLNVLATRDGSVVRRIATGTSLLGGVLVMDDGTAVVGGRDGHVRAYGPDGALRWDTATRDEVRSTPALARDGSVVVGSDDGGVYALDAASGAVRWRVATSGRVRSSARVDADGVLYVGSEDDTVYAIEAEGRVRWSVVLGADVDSSVAIAPGGGLVVGCDDGGVYWLGDGR